MRFTPLLKNRIQSLSQARVLDQDLAHLLDQAQTYCTLNPSLTHDAVTLVLATLLEALAANKECAFAMHCNTYFLQNSTNKPLKKSNMQAVQKVPDANFCR